MPQSPESLLQLLQKFIKHSHKTKQIHSLLITNGYLHVTTKASYKWMKTLLYNALIRAHLNTKQPKNTLLLFTHMLSHQVPPNNFTFPTLIKAASNSFPSLGKPIHTHVIKNGLFSDLFIRTSLVSFYAHSGIMSDARNVFDEILQPCIVCYNAMLDAYGKNGNMDSAVLMFERMVQRDIVSWTSVINGFGRNGLFSEGIRFFGKMMVDKDVVVRPNEATFVSVLSSCANLDGGGGLCKGKEIHGFIIRNEIGLTIYMATALIALYGKMGCVESAFGVFNNMIVREICAWNAMISSLASNGREKQALEMFYEMKLDGMRPNEVTFVAVLIACARAKLVDFGMELFESMLCEFGIVPKMEHYGCVVDLLGRSGLLREAAEFIERMPFEPDATVLGALLGACKVHGAVGLANRIGKRLLELQPQHCGRYVVLSSIHAGAERWSHAADLRKTMVEAGIRKIPASSSINTIYEHNINF